MQQALRSSHHNDSKISEQYGIQAVIDMYKGAANDNVYNLSGREGILAQMPADIQSVLDSHLRGVVNAVNMNNGVVMKVAKALISENDSDSFGLQA